MPWSNHPRANICKQPMHVHNGTHIYRCIMFPIYVVKFPMTLDLNRDVSAIYSTYTAIKVGGERLKFDVHSVVLWIRWHYDCVGPRMHHLWQKGALTTYCIQGPLCRMDLPGPTTSVGTRTDYSVGPWDYPTCVARYLLAWGARTTVEKYSDRKLRIPCTV
jgi:hypothetical protein